jgi:hypothetical protein
MIFIFLADLHIMSIESEDTGKHARVTLVGKRFADTVLKTQDMIMPLTTVNIRSIIFTVCCYFVSKGLSSISFWVCSFK